MGMSGKDPDKISTEKKFGRILFCQPSVVAVAEREMRALATRLIKRELFSITKTPPPLKYLGLSAAAHGEGETNKTTTTKKKSSSCNSHILGPDLPDVWTPHDANSEVPPLSSTQNQIQDNEELIPKIIDGKSIAQEIRSVIAEEVRQMNNAISKVPGLAVVFVGQRRDSLSYIRFKTMACEEVGIKSLLAELPDDCADDDVVNAVLGFNEDPSIHGILVQLPLPQHMNEEKILSAISPDKDVDGFHPLNVGNLAMSGGAPLFIPCAAKACIELLLRSGVELMAKNVAVIGRSKVVGLPTSLLLQRHHATVSTVHAFTKNPEDITREADIVISAAGVPNLVRRSWLKRGSVVIDVGTNPVEDPNSEHGYYLTGDVFYEEALQVVSAITPVPGGVGPVTVAMLLANTLESAKRTFELS